MYDLHTHTLLSDGVLLASELAARYMAAGYKAIAVCDHADYSNIDNIIDSILNFTRNWPIDSSIKVFPGIELTHLPPQQFNPLAKYARSKGIKIIVAHGQTPVEPVVHGTNRAALEADIDILAHPGLISDEDVRLAKAKGIFLEITARRGHRDTNNHVAARALELGARLIIDTDCHSPEDILTTEQLKEVAFKAGISLEQTEKIYLDVERFLKTKEG
jgi:histidinol phosphatase-like PHP family hydrolase